MEIKIGARGKEVQKIQKRLGLTDDGIFGVMTESAVKEWEIRNGFNGNGIIEQHEWDYMFESKTSVNLKLLEGYLPKVVLQQLPEVINDYDMNSILRLSHFLSQCEHESGRFKYTVENLNYSEKALKSVFGKYFPGNLAQEYARKPEKIGSRVYANRMGNGDESSGEGFKYRGRGYIQITGKNNYSLLSDYLDVDLVRNPDLISEEYPLISAAWFFKVNNLNTISDMGETPKIVKMLTRRINGGYHGLDDRLNRFNKFFDLLNR